MEKTVVGLLDLFNAIGLIFNKIEELFSSKKTVSYAFSSPPPFTEGCEGKKCECYWLCKAGHRLSLSCEIMKTKDQITKKGPLTNQKHFAGKPQIRKEEWKKNGSRKFFSEKCAEEKKCPAFSLCQGGYWIGDCDKMRQRFQVTTSPANGETKKQPTERKISPTREYVVTTTKTTITTITTDTAKPAAERQNQIKKKPKKKIWPWSKKDVDNNIKTLMEDTKIAQPTQPSKKENKQNIKQT
jgi:hypothetical protein